MKKKKVDYSVKNVYVANAKTGDKRYIPEKFLDKYLADGYKKSKPVKEVPEEPKEE